MMSKQENVSISDTRGLGIHLMDQVHFLGCQGFFLECDIDDVCQCDMATLIPITKSHELFK